MKLTTNYMVRNDCYKAERKITPKGIMVHSTAAPGVMAPDWFSRWNKSYKAGEINRQACVHAFLDDTAVVQYLPWNHRGWHAGGGANDTHIGFEICEPSGHFYQGSTMVNYNAVKNEAYFRAAWSNAVSLCAYLCKMYGLNESHILCHSEGSKKGIASNSADVMHWFPRHGETMDSFRAAVKKALAGSDEGGAGEIPANALHVGSAVEIKNSAREYYPGGPSIPLWVKNCIHIVTQTASGGKPVVKGGQQCVLLGKMQNKANGADIAGINTWVSLDAVNAAGTEPKAVAIYKVVKGDTLWKIASLLLGDGSRYMEIVNLNNLKTTVLQVGQILTIPE